MKTIVETKYGTLKGKMQKGAVCFLGVPYAKPPVGELRFRKPVPCEPWEGVRDATRFGNFCPQPRRPVVMDKKQEASEDCLYLNVYTPACDGKRRPVVFIIHGGAYLTGTSSEVEFIYDRAAARDDIVYVTINYRLGPLGAVDFSTLSGAGDRFDPNCGTWDQLMALDWVIDNIEAFGGDPKEITVTGPSAGGTSVMTLLASPYTKGKIRRAVMESPAPYLPLTRENAYVAAKDIIDRLGVKEKDAIKLTKISAEKLVKATNASENNYMNVKPYTIPTGPVIDGDLVPELPFDALRKGAADGVDILIGTTKDEGSLFATKIPSMNIFPTTEEQLGKFYRENPGADEIKQRALFPDHPSFRSYQHLAKEIFFHSGVLSLAKAMSERGNRVYVYHFEYENWFMKLITLRSMHTLNTLSLCENRFVDALVFGGRKGRRTNRTLRTHWVSFFRTGNVNSGKKQDWKPYGEEKNTFCIDGKGILKQAPFSDVEEAFCETRPYQQ